ncbi:MAG: hypothetical protein HY321_01520, partial [Armatimonadetes bacterium]|nr:hypothetical protein [Armatimonadota bacterium]
GLGVNTNPLYHSSALLDARGALLGLQPVTLDRIKVQEQSPLPDILAGCMLVSPAASGRLSEILAARRPVTFAELAAACVAEGLPLAGARSTKQCITMDYPWEILGASFLGIRLTFDRPEPIRQFAPTAKVHPDAILKNTVIVGEGAIVESGAVLDDVILDAGCHIREHSYLMRTILGPGCRIGPTGYTHHTVLGPRCSVGFPGECPVAVGFGRNGFGHHCHAGMGVYGERAVLNAGAIVTANRGNPVKTKIQGRLMDTGWFNIGAFLGDGVRLNAQATVMPGRIIGARSVIGPGVIVYHDVPPDTLLVLKQELQETKIEPR